MEWIVDPAPQVSPGGVSPEACWFDFCGAFCGIQNCHKQGCSSHTCGLYLYDVETPM